MTPVSRVAHVAVLVLTLISPLSCAMAQDISVPKIPLEQTLTATPSISIDEPETAKPEGVLALTVRTVQEKTPRQWSIMPYRIEVWTKDKLLAALTNSEAQVENARHRRTFRFPDISLAPGYYFLSIRGYAEGFMSRDQKWKGKTIQVGIHAGKRTVIEENLQMFVW